MDSRSRYQSSARYPNRQEQFSDAIFILLHIRRRCFGPCGRKGSSEKDYRSLLVPCPNNTKKFTVRYVTCFEKSPLENKCKVCFDSDLSVLRYSSSPTQCGTPHSRPRSYSAQIFHLGKILPKGKYRQERNPDLFPGGVYMFLFCLFVFRVAGYSVLGIQFFLFRVAGYSEPVSYYQCSRFIFGQNNYLLCLYPIL